MSRKRHPDISSIPIGSVAPSPHQKPDPSLYDSGSHDSLMSVVGDAIRVAIEALDPRYFTMTESALRAEVQPDAFLCRIRLAFWDEYNRAIDKRQKMRIQILVKGVCSYDYFYKVILKEPRKLAWVVTPPLDHMYQQREILESLAHQVRQIARARVYVKDKETGKRKLDVRVAQLVLQAYDKMHDKVYGASVQRVAHAHAHQVLPSAVSDAIPSLSGIDTASLEQLESIEAQMAKISSAVEETKPLGEVIDADEIPVEALVEDTEQ